MSFLKLLPGILGARRNSASAPDCRLLDARLSKHGVTLLLIFVVFFPLILMYFNIDCAHHAHLHYIFVITVVRRDSF